jgi:hypothetical protein
MRSKFLLILSLFLFSGSFNVKAQTDVNGAQAIFIYNFLSHIKWPDAEIGNKYVIGVLGKSPTYNYLQKTTANRKIGSKSIEVVQYNNIAEAKNCQVLFVAYGKSSLIPEIKNTIANKSCLIIGEKAGTVDSGAVVDFHIINGKLRYKISETNARQHNLFVSKTLLTMSL